MEIKDILIAMAYSLVMMISIVYSWYKLINHKIDFKNYILYITIAGMDLMEIVILDQHQSP